MPLRILVVAVTSTFALLWFGRSLAWAEERQYLVAGHGKSLPSPQAVAAAGGIWVDQIQSIGVAIVRSADPDFLSQVKKDKSVSLAAPDIDASIPEADGAEEASLPSEGQPISAAGLSNDPLSVLEWDNMVLGVKEKHDLGVKGEGVTIAVVDTGIDKTHPDLVDSVLPTGISFLSDPNPFPTTGNPVTQGHGTGVAGIIAAACDNGIGVCGIAPYAKLLSVRISDGTPFPVSRILQGYDWASTVGVASYGVRIINASHIATCHDSDPECHANIIDLMGIANRMMAKVFQRGVVLFAAAGNGDENGFAIDVSQDDGYKLWPAGHKAVTVGATGPCCVACDGDPLNDDNYDLPAVYSNFGFSQEDTRYLVMPGGQRAVGCTYPTPNRCTVALPVGPPLSIACQRFDMIWSTSFPGSTSVLERYMQFSGTSAAVPQAVGLAALMLSREISQGKDLKPGQLIDAMLGTGNSGVNLMVDLGEPGYDLLFGYGRGSAALIP